MPASGMLAALWGELRAAAAAAGARGGRGGGVLDRLCLPACPCLVVSHADLGRGERARGSPGAHHAELETLVMGESQASRTRSSRNSMVEDDAGGRSQRPGPDRPPPAARHAAPAAADAHSKAGGAAGPGPGDSAECSALPDDVVGDDEDPYGEAGQCCSICAAETRCNTHFAVPCRHAACEQCWNTWLKDNSTCMMCCTRVHGIKRFAHTLVPEQPLEAPGSLQLSPLHAINQELEAAVGALLESLVFIKSRLGSLDEQLEEMQSHLKGSAWRMSPDALSSVASVEMQALEEHLAALHHILLVAGDRSLLASTPPFVLLHSRIRALMSVLARLGQTLDSPAEGGGLPEERGDERGSVRTLGGLDVTLQLLKDCTCKVIRGQWTPSAKLVASMCHERVPSILKTLAAIGVVDAASVAMARQLQRRADDEMPRTRQALEALLPEIDLMLIRVESCFDNV